MNIWYRNGIVWSVWMLPMSIEHGARIHSNILPNMYISYGHSVWFAIAIIPQARRNLPFPCCDIEIMPDAFNGRTLSVIKYMALAEARSKRYTFTLTQFKFYFISLFFLWSVFAVRCTHFWLCNNSNVGSFWGKGEFRVNTKISRVPGSMMMDHIFGICIIADIEIKAKKLNIFKPSFYMIQIPFLMC